MKKIQIGIDFDNTLSVCGYPDAGRPVPGAFESLERVRNDFGDVLDIDFILYTMRSGHVLDNALRFCHENGLKLTYANANREQDLWEKNNNLPGSRKVYADIYIDDRNIGIPLIEIDDEMCVDWNIVGENLYAAVLKAAE
jgi:hypothetical protein